MLSKALTPQPEAAVVALGDPVSIELCGKHLINGQWVSTPQTFESMPVSGDKYTFFVGTPACIDAAAEAAESAFWSFGYSTVEARSQFLYTIAERLEAKRSLIVELGSDETGLPAPRLEGELSRTTGQLRLFAQHILQKTYLDARLDEAIPDRTPVARPEIKMVQRPIGPVAVFGASNFPLAFSVAGGDTAAALAAGCPVVVKGHSGHPGTSELVAGAILEAIHFCDVHPGTFSLVQGGRRDVGERLVDHPFIQAVGFTGSLAGGRALFNRCSQRPNPIPFFGELGSINPMFICPGALSTRASEIASGWVASLTLGAGQFCTNPGLVVVPEGIGSEQFCAQAVDALSTSPPQMMLSNSIAKTYQENVAKLLGMTEIEVLSTSSCSGRHATPQLFRTNAELWLSQSSLHHEVFGPLGLIVTTKNADEMIAIARHLEGQLTCTLHMNPEDQDLVHKLLPILERKAGRILANGFPTGVEVVDSMVHGGPYPASTNFGHTSVGTLSIRRFLRPVCYQNMPDLTVT